MRFRSVAVPLLALGLLAVPAEAAPKPRSSSCDPLLTDPREATWSNGLTDIDIVSARLTLTATELVGVLTVAGPPTAAMPEVRAQGWGLTFVSKGVAVSFARRRPVGMSGGDRTSVTVHGTEVPHTVAISGTDVVWRVKRTAMPLFKKGAIAVTSASAYTTTYSTSADDAERTEKKACVLKA